MDALSATTRATLEKARRALQAGELVGVPTDTVYGIAVRPDDRAAVERLFALKGRSASKALSLLIADPATVAQVAVVPDNDTLMKLARAFWPGPLTIVLRARSDFEQYVDAGTGKLGVRIPAHPLSLELLRRWGGPLAVPSANPSGQPSATSAESVRRYFGDALATVIDGGRCAGGVESTVIDLSVSPPRILRQGALTTEELATHLGNVVSSVSSSAAQSPDAREALLVIGVTRGELPAAAAEIPEVHRLDVETGADAARELHDWLTRVPLKDRRRAAWYLCESVARSREAAGIRAILTRYCGDELKANDPSS